MDFLKTGDPDIDKVSGKLRNWVLSILFIAIPVFASKHVAIALGLNPENFFVGLGLSLTGTVVLFPVALLIFCKMNNREITKQTNEK